MQTPRSDSGWPRVTVLEMLLVVTVLAVLYGLAALTKHREAVIGAVSATPFLIIALLLWRTIHQSPATERALGRVFMDAWLGNAARGVVGAIVGAIFVWLGLCGFLVPLFCGILLGGVSANIVGLVLGRYRSRR